MYDHYIALDWAKSNMAIARMTEKSNKMRFMEGCKSEAVLSPCVSR